MKYLNVTEMLDVVNGSCILASGGGGPLVPSLNLINGLPEETKVPLINVEEVEDDSLTAVVAFMGAPNAMASLETGDEVFHAFEQLNNLAGNRIRNLVSVETGAISVAGPFLTANKYNLNVVDGDGAGRAVPELPQLTYPACEVSTAPSVISNADGKKIILELADAQDTNEVVDSIIGNSTLFNEQVGLAAWLMTKEQLLSSLFSKGSITLSQIIGEATRTARSNGREPVQAVIDVLSSHGRKAYSLFTGEWTDSEETTSSGFDVGNTVIKNDTQTVRIYNQNENLIAWSSELDRPLVIAPDSACYLTNSGQAFSNADVTQLKIKGQQVTLIGIESIPALRDLPSIMNSFSDGLERIGYAGTYVPIEQLVPKLKA